MERLSAEEVKRRILSYLERYPSVGYLRLLEDVLRPPPPSLPPPLPSLDEDEERRRELYRLGMRALRELEEAGVIEVKDGAVNLLHHFEGEEPEPRPQVREPPPAPARPEPGKRQRTLLDFLPGSESKPQGLFGQLETP